MHTVTYSTIADDDAIKTSIASSASPASYVTTALNGVIGTKVMNPARTLTVKNTTHASSYVAASTVTISGLDAVGHVQTEVFTVVGTGGGETLVGVKAFSEVTSIAVDAQTDTSGAFLFGVRDIVCEPLLGPQEVRIGTSSSSSLKVGYPNGQTDIFVNCTAGEHLLITPSVIYGDSNTTVQDVTLFFRPA